MNVLSKVKGWKLIEPLNNNSKSKTVSSDTHFVFIDYDFKSKSHDTRELNVYCGNDGATIDISDYTTMNEFGSQRNEGSKRVSLDRDTAIKLRDTLINQYPIK